MDEIWKDIPGYEGMYQVSDYGNVRAVTRTILTSNHQLRTYQGHLIPSHSNRSGYQRVTLYKNNKSKMQQVHQLVLKAFVGPCPENWICRHFPDRSPSNNKLDNLSWGTKEQNNGQDRVIHGTDNRGERCGTSKLTEKEVLEIRNSVGIYQKDLANKYGVSRPTISNIIQRETWRHV